MVIVRKIKDKLQKLAPKKIVGKIKGLKKPKVVPPAEKKEDINTHKLAIEQAKFSHPEPARAARNILSELPYKYDQDKIVLQVRDSWWIHAYWEVRDQTLGRLKSELGDEFYRAKRVLRVYDVSQIIFDGSNAHRHFDIHINEHATNWYIDTAGPGRSWCVDYGLLLSSGRFITILRSNVVQTPLEGPSWITDEEWMIPDDMFARLYGMGFGLGRSSPVGKAWRERILSSPGITSGASPVKKIIPEKKFWMVVDCELIVYGATEPTAKVTVQGKPIDLRQDGTFTLRFALPDGKQAIPVKAVAADNSEQKTITPTVSRETKIG